MVTCEGLVTALPDSFRSYLKNKVFGFSVREHSQPERLTQVHLTDLGVGKDFFRTPGRNDRALIDDVGPGADPEGLAHIMVSDQDPDAAMRQLADDALDIQHGQRIHARKRLIQEHEPRLGRQGAGDLDAPPLPARERQAENSAHVADAQLLEQLDRKSTRLNSSHGYISYAVFCLKKKKHLVLFIDFHHDIFKKQTLGQ